MKSYKNNTNSYKIDLLMRRAVATESEVEIHDLINRDQEKMPRATFAMFLRRIRLENFPAIDFYSRTRRDGVLVIGVRK